MANKKISQLDPAAALTGAEGFPVVQDGDTVEATVQAVLDIAADNAADAFDVVLQNAEFQCVFDWGSNGSNATPTIGGSGTPMSTSTQGTVAAGVNSYTGALLLAVNRIECSASGSNDIGASVHQTNTFAGMYRRTSGNSRGGGFDIKIWFGLPDVKTDQRAVIGVYGNNSTPPSAAVDPSSNTGHPLIAFAKDSADTNLQVMTNTGSGTANKIDTGLPFAGLADKLLRARFEALAGGTSVAYELFDEETGTVLTSGTVSTSLPAADLPMWWVALASTATSTTLVGLTWVRTLLHTKFGINF